MSDLWLNTFHGYACNIAKQPKCRRDTPLYKSDAAGQGNNMAWETFGDPIEEAPKKSQYNKKSN